MFEAKADQPHSAAKMNADVEDCFFSKCGVPCRQSFYTISTTSAGLNSHPLVASRRLIGLEVICFGLPSKGTIE